MSVDVSQFTATRLFVQKRVQANKKKYQMFALLEFWGGNPTITDGVPAQRANNAVSVSFSWRHNCTLQKVKLQKYMQYTGSISM